MMYRFGIVGVLCLGALLGAAPALAQNVWLQIEAKPGRVAAARAADRYDDRLEDVAGFRLGATNWYAIVLGPFPDADAANARRRALRGAGRIPGDSFVTGGASFRERFWPDATARPTPAAQPVEAAPEPEAPPLDPAVRNDAETTEAARAAEATLTEFERRRLQRALADQGFYRAAIDGDFGRGTRAAMTAWQRANGLEPTGVLTTAQRGALVEALMAPLADLGVEIVRDETAGVAIAMPTGRVTFERYAPPFARYGADDGPARVLLISQRGGRADLYGLYDIMQTLEVVPPRGERRKRPGDFLLVGEAEDVISHTEARLVDGAIKGFTLVWPTGDEDRRQRLLTEMQESFAALPAVMDDDTGTAREDQGIDLVAGLRIRQPRVSRSGFYVSSEGAVLTTRDAAEGCGRITLDDGVEAEVVATDPAGLALLAPATPLSPRAHARFHDGVPRIGAQAIVAGYSYDGALSAPSLIFGKLADLRGLNGEEGVDRLAMAVHPGDAGGPVLDEAGAVLGMVLPGAEGARALPGDVTFAADTSALVAFLEANDIAPATATDTGRLARGRLEDRAAGMTVHVGCWE